MWAIAGLIGLALAAAIFLARPGGVANRWLALALFAQATASVFAGVRYGLTDPALYVPLLVTDLCAAALSFGAYLAFLGTLVAPLARPFSGPLRRWATAFVGVLLASFVVVRTDWMVGPVVARATGPPLGSPYVTQPSLGQALFITIGVLVVSYGIAVALQAWREAPVGSVRRTQAASYAVAFGARDVSLLAAYGMALSPGQKPAWLEVSAAGLLAVGFVVFGAVTAFAILRFQLFDIELRLKWTLHRGSLAGVFLAVFFMVAVVAENFLTGQLGWIVGGIAAGLLLFALTPLQRMAEGLADRAMPRVARTDDYVQFRKLQVYQSALEEMLQDGSLSTKDERVLASLAGHLGLQRRTVERLRRDALAQRI